MRPFVSVLAVGLVAALVWWLAGSGLEPAPPDRGDTDAGLAPAEPRLEGRLTGEPADASLDELGTARLWGRVVDAAGVPQPGVRVTVHRSPRQQGRDWHATLVRWVHRSGPAAPPIRDGLSGADGSFSFTGLPHAGWLRIEACPTAPRVGASREFPAAYLHAQSLLLVVQDGVALEGRVVDADGVGVVAQIDAQMGTGPLRDQYRGGKLELKGIRTDAEGHFRIPALPEGVAELSVYVPGRIRRPFLVPVPSEGVILRVFEKHGFRVHGRVNTPAGAPVPGAQVVASLREAATGDAFYGVASSDPDGHYAMDGFPASSVGKVMAVAPGHRPGFYGGGDRSAEPGSTIEADITLVPGVRLTGDVVSETGDGLAGIQLYVRGPNLETHRTTTGAGGAFEIEGLAPDSRVSISGIGGGWYIAEQADGRVTGPGVGAVPVPVGSDGGQTRLIAIRAFELDVEVVRSSGQAASGAQVELLPGANFGSFGHRHVARAGEDGHCRMGVAPGTEHIVLAHLDGEVARRRSQAWGTGGGASLRLVLEPAGMIAGQVQDSRGTPVADISVTLKTLEHGDRHGTGTTGADGRFTFRGLVAGRYRLRLSGPTVPEAKRLREDVELAAGDQLSDLTLLVPDSATLSGVVVDTTGRPVAFRRLGVIDGQSRMLITRTVTDEAGRFTAEVSASGEYLLLVGAETIPGTWPARAGLRVVLADPHSLRVVIRIVDPEGNPVPRVSVSAVRRNNESTSTYPHQVDGGELAVPRPLEGWKLSIEVSEPRDADGNPLDLLAATAGVPEGQDEVEIVLARGRRITGQVVDASGAPVVGVRVSTGTFQSVNGIISATSDAGGHFMLVAVPSSDMTVYVQTPAGFLPAPGRVVRANESDVVFRLAAGDVTVVRVVGPDDAPLAGVLVKLSGRHLEKHWRQQGSTNAEGRARIAGTPHGGTARVYVHGRDHGFPDVHVAAEPLSEHELVVRLPAPVWIEGTLADADGAVPPRARAKADGAAPGLEHVRLQAVPDATGHFRLGPLAAGRYAVRVSAGRGYVESGIQEVTAPATGLRLTVPKAIGLTGRIVDDAPGGWTVRFAFPDEAWLEESNADGSFEIDDLRDDPGTLHAFNADGRCALLENVRPSDGPFELQGIAGTRVASHVPAGTAQDVGLGLERGSFQIHAYGFDANGRFEVKGVPPGRWTLFIAQDGMVTRGRTIDVGTADVEVAFAVDDR